jgi:hypothetical protein
MWRLGRPSMLLAILHFWQPFLATLDSEILVVYSLLGLWYATYYFVRREQL